MVNYEIVLQHPTRLMETYSSNSVFGITWVKKSCFFVSTCVNKWLLTRIQTHVDAAASFTPKLHSNASIEDDDMLTMLVNNATWNGVSKSNMPLNDAKLMLLMTLGTTDDALMTKQGSENFWNKDIKKWITFWIRWSRSSTWFTCCLIKVLLLHNLTSLLPFNSSIIYDYSVNV